MATAQLQAELADSKAEIQRLKERLSSGLHRDLCLISLTQNWRGLKSGIPQIKFLSSIEKFKESFYASLREGHRPNSTAVRAYAAHYVYGQHGRHESTKPQDIGMHKLGLCSPTTNAIAWVKLAEDAPPSWKENLSSQIRQERPAFKMKRSYLHELKI
jgi:hypothetical protein